MERKTAFAAGWCCCQKTPVFSGGGFSRYLEFEPSKRSGQGPLEKKNFSRIEIVFRALDGESAVSVILAGKGKNIIQRGVAAPIFWRLAKSDFAPKSKKSRW